MAKTIWGEGRVLQSGGQGETGWVARREPGDLCLRPVSIPFVAFLCKYGEYSVRFVVRLAACNPPWATGQRAVIRGKADKIFFSGLWVISSSVIFPFQHGECSVRFAVRPAACTPPRATGQRAQGRALCTPCLATSLPAASRYLHSFMCPLRTGHDSLLLSMTSRRVPAARPGHIHSLSGAMSPDQRCWHPRKSG